VAPSDCIDPEIISHIKAQYVPVQLLS
jgi:hypothetical protein